MARGCYSAAGVPALGNWGAQAQNVSLNHQGLLAGATASPALTASGLRSAIPGANLRLKQVLQEGVCASQP